MATINLVRVDDRLIHGQVITRWVNSTKSNRIIIVDDELAKNEFLMSVFELAKPPGVDIETKATDQVAGEWQANQMGTGKLLILFKRVEQVKQAIEKGFAITELQVAGLAAGAGKKRVYKTVSLSSDEPAMLKEVGDKGIKVFFQMLPEETPQSLQNILKSNFKELA